MCRPGAALMLLALAWGVSGQESVRPQFEAASVKPASSDCSTDIGRMSAARASIGATAESARLRFTCATLGSLISFAYDLSGGVKIEGGPKWLEANDTQFEVNATAGSVVTLAQRKLMLQALLADRFQLRAHRERPVRPVFALVVAKSGPKLHEVAPGTELHGQIRFGMSGKTMSWTGVKAPISEVIAWLRSSVPERPVIDATGLTGAYDFKLEWLPEPDQPTAALFSALEQELGLRLEARTAPVEVLVVDRAEKPTANE